MERTILWSAAFVLTNTIYFTSGLYLLSSSESSIKYFYSFYRIVRAFVGTGTLLSASRQIAKHETVLKRVLLICGQTSMEIYCTHTFPMFVTRKILQKIVGFRYLWINVLLQTSVCVVAGCLVFSLWPNDRYLHLILFGEPKERKKEEKT